MGRVKNGQGEAWPNTCEGRGQGAMADGVEGDSHHRAILGKILPVKQRPPDKVAC